MMNYIDIGYAQIAHQKVGSGPDLLFIHGWPLDSQTFRHIVSELQKDFTCHLIDLPGTGQTRWSKSTPISLQDHTESIRRVIEHLSLDRFGVIAHDSGGIMARYIAAQYRERVAGLLLGNTDMPKYRSKPLDRFVKMLALPGMVHILPLILRSKKLRTSTFGGALFYDIKLFEQEFKDLFMLPLIHDKGRLPGQLRLIQAWDWDYIEQLDDIHAELNMPVQLIWGRNDVIFPLKYAKKMRDEFAGPVELHVVKDSNLFVHEEHPEIFAQHAIRFFSNRFESQLRQA